MSASRRALRVVIAGGGTGGHVFPALALAEQLLEDDPGAELLFVGSVGGLEQRLVPARGHRIELLRVGRVRGEGLLPRAAALARLPLALGRAGMLLGRFAPHVVVGLGGYASAPVVLAAAPLRVPTVLLEQNAVPGTVNRALARLARTTVTSFRRAARHLPTGSSRLLGNPVRGELVRAFAHRPARSGPPHLLVLGGSQGARAINELVSGAAAQLVRAVPGLRVTHQTGPADHPWVARRYDDAGVEARVMPFIEHMERAYAAAHLVLGRSGATTAAELCVAGLPALLVPYPYAADDHQAHNAAELVEGGGALMVRQQELDRARLLQLVGGLLARPERLANMSRAMYDMARPDAAARIARLVRECAVTGR